MITEQVRVPIWKILHPILWEIRDKWEHHWIEIWKSTEIEILAYPLYTDKRVQCSFENTESLPTLQIVMKAISQLKALNSLHFINSVPFAILLLFWIILIYSRKARYKQPYFADHSREY